MSKYLENDNSFAYYIQQVLKESLSKYWDWEKNNELGINPYLISKGTNKIKIWIKCTEKDYHESYPTTPNSFTRGSRCPYCAGKKIHSKDSFGQWLIDTYGDDAIEKYWSPKNTLDPFTIAPQSSKQKVWILCQKHDYHNDFGGYETIPNKFYNSRRCPYCHNFKVHPKDSFAQWGIDTFGDDFLEKYWNWDKNNKLGINPWKIKPQSSKTIYIYCQDKDYHNDNGGYEIIISNFYKGIRCQYCSNQKIHYKDSFGSLYSKKAEFWSDKNKKSPFEVSPMSGDKYKFICEKCGEEFERDLAHLNRSNIGVVCRECKSSLLEQSTKKVLDKYNIKYNREYIYNDLVGVGNGLLRFDFYLPKYNSVIECQGEQHEKWTKGLQPTKKDFEQQLEHDKRKRDYCKKNDIKLIEIWYDEVDYIESILVKKLSLKSTI